MAEWANEMRANVRPLKPLPLHKRKERSCRNTIPIRAFGCKRHRQMTDDSFGRMSNLGGIVQRTVYEASADKSSKDFLKNHPGASGGVFDLGLPRIQRRIAEMGLEAHEEVMLKAAQKQLEKGSELCESPIERMMLAGLITGQWRGFQSAPPYVHNSKDRNEPMPNGEVVIVPQFAFVRYRMDFGIRFRVGEGSKIICVECDGKQYHQDAGADRDKDEYLKGWGIKVLRFTGREIHDDAIGCADAVIHECYTARSR